MLRAATDPESRKHGSVNLDARQRSEFSEIGEDSKAVPNGGNVQPNGMTDWHRSRVDGPVAGGSERKT
jgi:hypothetical protein